MEGKLREGGARPASGERRASHWQVCCCLESLDSEGALGKSGDAPEEQVAPAGLPLSESRTLDSACSFPQEF